MCIRRRPEGNTICGGDAGVAGDAGEVVVEGEVSGAGGRRRGLTISLCEDWDGAAARWRGFLFFSRYVAERLKRKRMSSPYHMM